MSAGVQHLCQELGSSQAIGEDGQPLHTPGGVLADIKQMLVASKAQGDNVLALEGSVNGLMAAVQENMQVAEARGHFRE